MARSAADDMVCSPLSFLWFYFVIYPFCSLYILKPCISSGVWAGSNTQELLDYIVCSRDKISWGLGSRLFSLVKNGVLGSRISFSCCSEYLYRLQGAISREGMVY